MSARTSLRSAPLYGLVLAGGSSRRMGLDKALIAYHGCPQLEHLWRLLGGVCERSFVSIRAAQSAEPLRAALPAIVDSGGARGPAAGILAAQHTHPAVAWLVVACDLPWFDALTLGRLIEARDSQRIATAYLAADRLPEPLCAIWEPASRQLLETAVAAGQHSPRALLCSTDVALLEAAEPLALAGADTPEERGAAERSLAARRSGT